MFVPRCIELKRRCAKSNSTLYLTRGLIVMRSLSWVTLKLLGKFRKPPACDHTVFHVEKLKDLTCAQEYLMLVSDWFCVHDALEDLVELWDTFKHETLEAAKECIGECLRSRSGFTSVEMLESTEESCTARLAGDCDQYSALSYTELS